MKNTPNSMLGHFSRPRPSQNISDKILLDNNKTPLLKKEIQKNVCNIRRITLSKASIKFIILGLPGFVLNEFCRCSFAEFEN